MSLDTAQKVEILGDAARYDICRGCGTGASRVRDDLGRWIYPAVRPDGSKIALLKVLFTNACDGDCAYCVNRSAMDTRRVGFRAPELARLFERLRRRGLVQGLFLSSGICGSPDRMMERMIITTEIIRFQYHFRGYIHLKLLPGADMGSVERAVQLADRVSLNLEAPNPTRLARITGKKDFQRDLLDRMRWANRFTQEKTNSRTTQTTQFVVGASDESDHEVLETTSKLYREVGLHRAYFSAFQPVADTPLENHAPTPLLREHRLYQADFLLRQYGFQFHEIVFDEVGNLPTYADPKTAWALRHPEIFPMEINCASREELLRIPGIGPVSANRIVKLRTKGTFRSLSDLRKLRLVTSRTAPFVLLDGKRPPMQLSLWDAPPGSN
ncbi:MAG: radical SAM protein [Anaerolineae bacterium]|nr:radical SAM protein [Anaerolineae bacterium]